MVLLMSDGFSWDWKDTNVSRRRKWGQGSLPIWPQVQLCKSSYISEVCVGVWLGGGGGGYFCVYSPCAGTSINIYELINNPKHG